MTPTPDASRRPPRKVTDEQVQGRSEEAAVAEARCTLTRFATVNTGNSKSRWDRCHRP